MKYCVLSLLMLVFAAGSKAQSASARMRELVNYVEGIDSISGKQQRTFSLNKIGRNNNPLKETWHYTIKDGKVAVFQVRYNIDSLEYNEVYYLDNGELICSEEYETLYKPEDDELTYGGIYYFNQYNVLQLITLGKKYGVSDNFQRDKYSLARNSWDRFRGRYAELKENVVSKDIRRW